MVRKHYHDLVHDHPDFEPLPCPTFEDAFAAVTNGEAALAMRNCVPLLAGCGSVNLVTVKEKPGVLDKDGKILISQLPPRKQPPPTLPPLRRIAARASA